MNNYLILVCILVLCLFSCSQKVKPKKVSFEMELNSLLNARFVDYRTLVFYDTLGKKISYGEMLKYDRNNYVADKYANEADSIIFAKIRPKTKVDSIKQDVLNKIYENNISLQINWIRKSIKDSANIKLNEGLAYYNMPYTADYLDCTNVKQIIDSIANLDLHRNNKEPDFVNKRIVLSTVINIMENCCLQNLDNGDLYNIFMALQHSDTRVNYKLKYLLKFKNLIKVGKMEASLVALMEDRILIEQKKKQKYGTQIFTNGNGDSILEPVENINDIDEIRKSVGLGPLKDYMQQHSIKFK
jgi:hypothetical protein